MRLSVFIIVLKMLQFTIQEYGLILSKFQFVVLLNGLHPSKVESVFVISTKDFGLEPKATINRKGKHRENTPLANSTRREHY